MRTTWGAWLPLAAGLAAATVGFPIVLAAAGGQAGESGVDRGAAGPSPVTRGRAVFTRMGCGSCHRLAAAGSRGEVGPELDQRLAGHTRRSLKAQIVDPPGGDGFGGMPDNFEERMSRQELDALVTFLLATRRTS